MVKKKRVVRRTKSRLAKNERKLGKNLPLQKQEKKLESTKTRFQDEQGRGHLLIVGARLMCQCDGATCCGGRGLAVYRVQRDAGEMLVCTWCYFPSDESTMEILPGVEAYMDELLDFDRLGAQVLAQKIKRAQRLRIM